MESTSVSSDQNFSDTPNHSVTLTSTRNNGSTYKTEIDSIVYSVINKFVQRADFGFKKYGTNLDRKDLSILDWIQHAQEEHMDAILYLEKLKQTYLDSECSAICNTPVSELNISSNESNNSLENTSIKDILYEGVHSVLEGTY